MRQNHGAADATYTPKKHSQKNGKKILREGLSNGAMEKESDAATWQRLIKRPFCLSARAEKEGSVGERGKEREKER